MGQRWFRETTEGLVEVHYLEGARLLEGVEERMVGQTTLDEARISTVFLSLDHRHGAGPPLVYETMIFWPGHDLDEYQQRYSTRAEAQAGHKSAVRLVAAASEKHGGSR